jgi:hypothetical protein
MTPTTEELEQILSKSIESAKQRERSAAWAGDSTGTPSISIPQRRALLSQKASDSTPAEHSAGKMNRPNCPAPKMTILPATGNVASSHASSIRWAVWSWLSASRLFSRLSNSSHMSYAHAASAKGPNVRGTGLTTPTSLRRGSSYGLSYTTRHPKGGRSMRP